MFRQILEQIVDTSGGAEGALGALLMDVDGIAVDFVQTPASVGDFNIESLGIEMSAALKQVARVATLSGLGAASEISTMFERYSVIVRYLSDEYFLVLVTLPSVPTGRSRYAARAHAHRLVSGL